MLPKGVYPAAVSLMQTDFGELACQFGKAKTGTQQVLVTFEILRGAQAGQKIGWFGYFTDATTERTLQALRICGFAGDDLDKFADQRPDNEVEIVVDHEIYEGKPKAKVQWVNAPGGVLRMADPLSAADMRKFSAQFKSKLKSMPAVTTKKAVREEPSAAAAPGDEPWSGNDQPDPPKENEPGAPLGDDGIPF